MAEGKHAAGHSPGPWSFDEMCFEATIPIRGGRTVHGRPYNVARVNRPESARVGQDKANAQLIAEAPAMLEALKVAEAELAALWSFYGQDLRVQGWHLNGDAEPLDRFFEENDQGALKAVRTAISRANGGRDG